MPHAPGVTDKVGEYAAEIADLRGIIEAKHQQCLYERSRLERYISSIDDSLLRQIFTYRFVNGLPWAAGGRLYWRREYRGRMQKSRETVSGTELK